MVWFLFLVFLTQNAECIMNPGFKPSQPDPYTPIQAANKFPSEKGHQALYNSQINHQTEDEHEHVQDFIDSFGGYGRHVNTTLEGDRNPIKIEITPTGVHNASGENKLLRLLVKNDGTEDEYVYLTVSDEKGYAMGNSVSEFPLPSQSSKEVSVRMDYPLNHTPSSSDLITIQARGNRNTLTVKRSIYAPGSDLEFGGGRNGPFCYDRYVNGNCRYRTDPEYCFQYEWTANAIIQIVPGTVATIRSEPEGLYVPNLEGKERVRVWVKRSCCEPYVKIISIDHFNRQINACVVDVRAFQRTKAYTGTTLIKDIVLDIWRRELQGLHPAEIAGIVLGVLFVLIVIIVVIALIIRRRRARSISVGQTTSQSPSHTHYHTHSRSRDRECVTRE